MKINVLVNHSENEIEYSPVTKLAPEQTVIHVASLLKMNFVSRYNMGEKE